MSPTRLLLACAIAAAATVAHADPVYSVAAPSGSYGLPGSFTAVGNAGIATDSSDQHATPAGVADGAAYLFTSYNGSSITVDVNASSFSFLWGSADWYNTVTYQTSLGDFSVTGSNLHYVYGQPLDGVGSTVFTATLAGGTINSAVFTSSDIAFEFAVAQAVPEPETYAMLAAGLIAVVFVARRRKV